MLNSNQLNILKQYRYSGKSLQTSLGVLQKYLNTSFWKKSNTKLLIYYLALKLASVLREWKVENIIQIFQNGSSSNHTDHYTWLPYWANRWMVVKYRMRRCTENCSLGQWHFRGPSPISADLTPTLPQWRDRRREIGKWLFFSGRVIGATAVRSLLGRAQRFPRLKSGTEGDDKVPQWCTTIWSNVKAIWLWGAPAQPHRMEHCCNSRRKLPFWINAR